MDLSSFRELLSPAGQGVLQVAMDLEPREEDFLRHFQNLNRKYPRELARAALEIAILRSKAGAKFPFGDKMYFTRPALEQATPYAVSDYRSQRYRPFDYLSDLACSVGGDTLSLAAIRPTIGIDLDLLRLAMAQANMRALNLANPVEFLQGDLKSPLPLSPIPSNLALFFDPARRTAGRRIYSVQDYIPPLSILQDWLPRFPALGVKISPGVKVAEFLDYDSEIEFISLRGELKEAVLWFGPLKTTIRRATVLPGPHTLASTTSWSVQPASREKIPLREPQAYLYEPDPAVIRAGLVQNLGLQLDAAQLDPDIAYLTAETQMPTPFARAWAVEDWFPFQLKRLRAYLRERNVGRVTVKKRGSPIQPEDLIRSLRLQGDEERLVFLTHFRGRPIVLICFT
jgi:hypothetical protein